MSEVIDADHEVIGKKIVCTRPLTEDELEREDWPGEFAPAIELDNGTVLYPARDEEGNGPGIFDSSNDDEEHLGKKVARVLMRAHGGPGIELDDGTRIVVCQDAEHNDTGALFWANAEGGMRVIS